jgi:hypothetical protein
LERAFISASLAEVPLPPFARGEAGCAWLASRAAICRDLQHAAFQVSVGYEGVNQLITQRSLVQIQPPQPPESTTEVGAEEQRYSPDQLIRAKG